MYYRLTIGISIAISVLGLMMLIGGFVYDLMFAGISYQDPTVGMTERYSHHAGIASHIQRAGFQCALAGCVAAIVSYSGKRYFRGSGQR